MRRTVTPNLDSAQFSTFQPCHPAVEFNPSRRAKIKTRKPIRVGPSIRCSGHFRWFPPHPDFPVSFPVAGRVRVFRRGKFPSEESVA